jgi:Protein of unknown function (DUF1566)
MARAMIVVKVCAVAAMLVALDARGAAPDGRYTVGADSVVDNKTGLTWQRAPSSAVYTWVQADGYCRGLGLGGASWRLPAVMELLSLIDAKGYDPAIDAAAFSNTPAAWFWSSSTSADVAGYAWIVDFQDGGSASDGVLSSFHVRCVR